MRGSEIAPIHHPPARLHFHCLYYIVYHGFTSHTPFMNEALTTNRAGAHTIIHIRILHKHSHGLGYSSLNKMQHHTLLVIWYIVHSLRMDYFNIVQDPRTKIAGMRWGLPVYVQPTVHNACIMYSVSSNQATTMTPPVVVGGIICRVTGFPAFYMNFSPYYHHRRVSVY